jgi:glycosyltransferase involved in cell wall biosynthesis
MRILVLSNLHPHSTHSVRAANIVIFELVRALAAEKDVHCGFLHVRPDGVKDPSDQESEGLAALAEAGVEVLPHFSLPANAPVRAWRRYLVGGIGEFYPQVQHRERVWSAIQPFKPDIILIPWCEWLTALCGDMPIPKFAYYGNPDAKSASARLRFAREHGEVDLASMLLQSWDNRSLERAHLRQMKKYPMLGDIAANDAQYYASRGHPNAFYVRNLWIDRQPGGRWRSARRALERKNVIIGNVGRLPGTANTLGLELLGRELLPLLRERLAGESYRVRILGAGRLHHKVAPYFETPEVDMAGFVPDIDEAILEAGVFLCVNNASHFKVGHTRYLHAWSLGACIVAHRDAALSMPEIRHNENALLGDSIPEIADLVKQAINDEALRRRIGEAGYDTFVKLFTAESVARSVVERIGGRG